MWALSDGDPAASDAASEAFCDAGLIWVAPPRHFGYEETPRNGITFAHTGGNGVHYSWLDLHNGEPDNAPIVMTVPGAMERPNTVVGENLRDFLHLGCQFGYFALEQLAYDWDETVAQLEIQGGDFEQWPEMLAKLEQLTRHFELAPWPYPGKRLKELQERFAHLITLGTH